MLFALGALLQEMPQGPRNQAGRGALPLNGDAACAWMGNGWPARAKNFGRAIRAHGALLQEMPELAAKPGRLELAPLERVRCVRANGKAPRLP